MSGIGVVVVLGALVVTAAVAWWVRTRNGAVRTPAEAPAHPPVVERLGAPPAAAALTVVQFSTAFCGPCRSTKARLEHLRASRPRLAYVHVDAERPLDEGRAPASRRTPPLFYLDREGQLIGRSSGAPRAEELTALVDAHAGAGA